MPFEMKIKTQQQVNPIHEEEETNSYAGTTQLNLRPVSKLTK